MKYLLIFWVVIVLAGFSNDRQARKQKVEDNILRAEVNISYHSKTKEYTIEASLHNKTSADIQLLFDHGTLLWLNKNGTTQPSNTFSTQVYSMLLEGKTSETVSRTLTKQEWKKEGYALYVQYKDQDGKKHILALHSPT
ncbi:hypothetical protein ACU3L3_19950 [Priestia endophytica]|jgi:hypothetical protein|uniref:Intracellular proteinase inhibitor BsuPI domain-containing protein n=1 Tax=Priestia endophytica DSM 13796 TaxID=1121089 RepID=A0A1I5YCG9_9BACI|nr:hypothetical protein [Priestia endophytica]KYG31686.1 hypothetical protein AZF06_08095 [Priestia endophytica]MBG9811457.1 hypothetical protein [Priestia endophytica]SFQ41914.1 hypothetical protein SAMN02745910_01377 [Priestia endophytica DSM 13796]